MRFVTEPTVLRTDAETLENFVTDRKEGRVGGTTAVIRGDGTALYFSKEVLPHVASLTKPPEVWASANTSRVVSSTGSSNSVWGLT